MLTQILVFWQSISLEGFRPFWYLIGIMLLTVFGMFLKGLLFSGVVGGSVSGIASILNIKVNKQKQKGK
ncbi:MAG: Spermidine export protein MdtJ [Mycoplasmataceae bacterium]|nr:MAG: Spermidine export protein MdtJ [Mycoplasmataceae bacterium]